MSNLVYTLLGTPITFKDSGGTYGLSLNGLAAGIGRISERADKGTGAQPSWFAWRATMQIDTTGVAGEFVRVYLSTSDGTRPDGEVGAADAALTEDQASHCQLLGHVALNPVDATSNLTTSGICHIPTRYFSIGVFAPDTDALEATANVSHVTLTPIPDEIQ